MKKFLLSAAVSGFLIQPISATYWSDLKNEQQEVPIKWNTLRIKIMLDFFQNTMDQLQGINEDYFKAIPCLLNDQLAFLNAHFSEIRHYLNNDWLANKADLLQRLDNLQHSIQGQVTPILDGYQNLQRNPNEAGAQNLRNAIDAADANLKKLFLGLNGFDDVKKALIPNYLGQNNPNKPAILHPQTPKNDINKAEKPTPVLPRVMPIPCNDRVNAEDQWREEVNRNVAQRKQEFLQLKNYINAALDQAHQRTKHNPSETIMPVGNIVAPTYWEDIQTAIQGMAPGFKDHLDRVANELKNPSFIPPQNLILSKENIKELRDKLIREKFISLEKEEINQSNIPLNGSGGYNHFGIFQEFHHDASVNRPQKLKTRYVWLYVANVMKYIYNNDKSDEAKFVLQNYFTQLADQGGRCYTGGVGRNFLALVNAYDYLLNMQPALHQPKAAAQPAPKAAAPAALPTPKATAPAIQQLVAQQPAPVVVAQPAPKVSAVAQPKVTVLAKKAPPRRGIDYDALPPYVPAPIPNAQPKAQPAPKPNPIPAPQPALIPQLKAVNAEPWKDLGITKEEYEHNLKHAFKGNTDQPAPLSYEEQLRIAIEESTLEELNRPLHVPAQADNAEPWKELAISEREYRHNMAQTFNGNPEYNTRAEREAREVEAAMRASLHGDQGYRQNPLEQRDNASRNTRNEAAKIDSTRTAAANNYGDYDPYARYKGAPDPKPLAVAPQPRTNRFASVESFGYQDYYHFMSQSREDYAKSRAGKFVTPQGLNDAKKNIKGHLSKIDERLFENTSSDEYRSKSIELRQFEGLIATDFYKTELSQNDQQNIRYAISGILDRAINQKTPLQGQWLDIFSFLIQTKYDEPKFRTQGEPILRNGVYTMNTVPDGIIQQNILSGLRAPHFLLKNIDRIMRASTLFPQKNFSGALEILLRTFKAVESALREEFVLTENNQPDIRNVRIKGLEETAYIDVGIEIARVLAER